jgi:hypothetical protein
MPTATTLSAMEQLPLLDGDRRPGARGEKPAAPPMGIVRRAFGRAMELLHALDRADPGLSRAFRRVLFADGGAALTEAERERFGNIFRASIFQRQALKFWWIPKERHITSRRTFELVEKRRRLPPGAIYIGSYEAPVHESAFLEDLDDLLEKMRAGCAIEGEPA